MHVTENKSSGQPISWRDTEETKPNTKPAAYRNILTAQLSSVVIYSARHSTFARPLAFQTQKGSSVEKFGFVRRNCRWIVSMAARQSAGLQAEFHST